MSNYPMPGPTPPGWYPDPEAADDVLQWWDGYRWTDDFAPRLRDPADSRNGYATAALVFGIVSLALNVLFVPTVMAIAFGVAGLGKARRMGEGRGLSIAGIVLGAVGAVAMVVLVGLIATLQVIVR